MLYNLKEKYIEYEKNINRWINNFLNNKYEYNFSKKLIENAKENNLIGFHSPKSYGSFGKDYLNHVLAIKEISRINPHISFDIIANMYFINCILKYSNIEQKVKYLTPLDKGEKIATIGLIEEKNQFNLNDIKTTIEKKDGKYVLNGKKYCSYNAEDADIFLILAKNENKNLSLVIAEKNYNGLQIISSDDYKCPYEKYMELKNINIPETNIIGDYDLGYEISVKLILDSHISLAAHYLGISINAYENIIEQLNNINNLKENRNLLEKFSDLSTNLEAAKLLIYKAAEMNSNGLECYRENQYAKLFSQRLAMEIINLELKLNSKNKNVLNPLRIQEDFNFNNIFNSDIEDINLLIADSLIESINCNKLISLSSKEKNISKRKLIIFEDGDLEEKIDNLIDNIINDLSKSNSSKSIYDDIEFAEKAVVFGLGIEDRENIKIIEEFAEKIGAVIGCTRPISEELEWMPNERYIGSTGKNFNGKIYFSLGLSGSIHHLNGIKNADTIVAINTDRHAKIFSNCDYGIVADLKEFIDVLLKKIQEKL